MTVQKQTVRRCPVHQTLMDEAVKQLEAKNAFAFEGILELCNYGAMKESIRWDYIREFIEEDTSQQLVPMAAEYFRRHSREHELANPGRFVAGAGGNKEAAGYLWFHQSTVHLVRHYLTGRHHQLDGAQRGYIAARAKVIERLGKEAAPPMLELFPALVLEKPAA
jgi:hypothetical protein